MGTAETRRAEKQGWAHRIITESDRQAVADGCVYSQAHANHIIEFFPKWVRHAKNRFAGQPFELLDWQKTDLLEPLFGWIRPDGKRRFRKAYIQIPKKNGKSTLAAGIGLYMLGFDGEAGSKVFSAASAKEQAKIVHEEAINTIDFSPALTKFFRINRATSLISYQSRKYGRCTYRALAGIAKGSHGFDGHCAIIDELHEWRGRDLWDSLKWMGVARDNPLIFVITTAGEDEESVCYEQYEYAKSILSGAVIDTRFFPLIYEATPEEVRIQPGKPDPLLDVELARKCNPSLGHTMDEDEFMADVQEALRQHKTREALLRLRFNMWVRTSQTWLDYSIHKQNIRDYSEEDLRGRRCFAGFDLSKTKDLTALTLVFPEGEGADRVYKRLNYFWLPEARATELAQKENCSHLRWAEDGWLKITAGEVCDYDQIYADVTRLSGMFRMQEIAYDPWQAENITQQFAERLGLERYEFRQVMSNYAGVCEEYERLLRLSRLHNNGNPVIGWQTRHVKVREDDNGNIRPVKPKKGDWRTIDGICSDLMALARALEDEGEFSGSLFIS